MSPENSDQDSLCTFCNLELIYEILKYIRSHCESLNGQIYTRIPYAQIPSIFNTEVNNVKYHCELLAKDGCFDRHFDEILGEIVLENIALKAEIRFQYIRRILGK